MNQETSPGSPPEEIAGSCPSGPSGPSGPKSGFDTFETDFFQQGDDSASIAVEVERFDDLDEGGGRKRFAPSRKLVLGLAVGGVCAAAVASFASWHVVGRAGNSTSPSESAPTLAAVHSEPAPAIPANPPAQPTPTDPAPTQPAPTAAPEPAPAMPTSAQPEPVAPAAAAGIAKPEAPAAVEPAPAKAVAAVAQAEVAAGPAEARDRCEKAISDRRNKEILAACAQAYETDPSAAGVAVTLAKIEFDRGRTAQALAWGKKAIAANPNTADAYVFIGGAEQSAGHGKAAKEAYKHYLQLAPGGRYASDLRAIVGTL